MERPEKIIVGGEQEVGSEKSTGTVQEFISKNADIVEGDHVFGKIIEAVNDGWQNLSEQKKSQIVTLLEDLAASLRIYHDSYVNLKFAAAPERRMLQQSDPEKYQEAMMAADKRERILHNAFIDSVNILSRNMKKLGLSNAWREDESIYATDAWGTRQKLKAWMFHMFREQDK